MKLRVMRNLTYATRRLLPGDVFEAKSRRDAKVLIATRKVEAVREPVDVPAPPPKVAEKIVAATSAPDERSALRVEYEKVLGKAPWVGWNTGQLREKIAAAKAGPASA